MSALRAAAQEQVPAAIDWDLIPDLEQADEFLNWLEPFAGEYTFQTFADTPKAKAEDAQLEASGWVKKYARIFHGTLSQHAAELQRLNNNGAGVFVTINETDFKARTIENIVRVRAVFSDTDGAPLEPHQNCELKPSVVIATSPQSWHVYWGVSELPLDKFKPVQWRIAEKFGSDTTVNDLPRVMRLPGFYHRKAEPYQVRILGDINFGDYAAEQILATFPPLTERPKSNKSAPTATLNQYSDPLPDDAGILDTLAGHVRTMLLDGVEPGWRSDAIFGVAKDLVKLGLTDDDIAQILTEPSYKLSAKAYEGGRTSRADAIRWTIDYTVVNARLDVANDIEKAFQNAPPAADIFSNLQPPPFPIDTLPQAVAIFVRDQSKLMGLDSAVIGMACIAALAGCIDDRIQIQPKRHDPTWLESARLWVGIIGDPSAKKSPGINKALGPVKKIAKKRRDEFDQARQKWQETCEALKAQDKKAKLPEGPKLERLTVSDTTVEKLGDILGQQEPRGILIIRDELSGWFASHDCYKNGAGGKDKAAWLEAYNGGGLEIDRIVRGSIWVENFSACIIGGIQPDVIHSYASTTSHDGLLQRFLLVHAGAARQGVDRMPDMRAKQRYAELIEQMINIAPPAGDVVTLSEGAHQIREAFYTDINRALRSMPNKHLTAMLGKWEGTFARLLLTFHVAQCAENHEYPTAREVDADTAQRVRDLMWRTLLPHAIRFYDGMDSTETHARALAALLLARGWERFTVKRDLNNNMLAYRKMKDWERVEMLDRLEAYSWIWPEPGGRLNERGRPVAYLVNPQIHKRYAAHAEQEKQRRADVAKMMAEIRSTTSEESEHE